MYDFKLKLQELFRTIGECNNMVLSTSTNDKISSRMMSIIMIDGCFYFQTDKEFRKSKQISENPNVALCFENISIEGRCSELGKPSKNDFFINLFQKHYNWSYNKYSLIENERLYVVRPVFVQRWIYENEEPYIERYDILNKQYKKIKYE